VKNSGEKLIGRIAGQKDMHGRVCAYKDYLITGFGGSRWYNGCGNQFSESDMAAIVRKVIRKVRLFRLQDAILGRKQKELIVISHAPPFSVHDMPDAAHIGFKCFHKFIQKLSPLLWLHGHVHLVDPRQQQVTVVGNTTVVNCYGYKFIKIERRKIQVTTKFDI
jgi:Icc-related predicted phosphoesterase